MRKDAGRLESGGALIVGTGAMMDVMIEVVLFLVGVLVASGWPLMSLSSFRRVAQSRLVC